MENLKHMKSASVALTALKSKESARVIQIKASDHLRLRKLTAFGIMPGCEIQVIQKYPAMVIQIGFTQVALDEEIASDIIVDKL